MTLAIAENASLQALNTFAIDANARYIITITQPDHIPQALHFASDKQLPFMLLGQGSNIIFSADYNGVILKMAISGIDISPDGDEVLVTAAAGESWHGLVCHCLQRGYFGLENLAFIPGTVGAGPIQNIGAYGVELSSLLESVTGWDIELGQWRTLDVDACNLSYRDSIFKQSLKDKFVISSVCLRLQLTPNPKFHYGALAEQLADEGIDHPTPQQVADAVIRVRQTKLPDPAVTPNAGSFFKNPIVASATHCQLQQQYPELVSYPQPDGRFKLAAGWLLEQAGWKGANNGSVGIHDQQALVLINCGNASGTDVLDMARTIQNDIAEKFGIMLEIEPQVY